MEVSRRQRTDEQNIADRWKKEGETARNMLREGRSRPGVEIDLR